MLLYLICKLVKPVSDLIGVDVRGNGPGDQKIGLERVELVFLQQSKRFHCSGPRFCVYGQRLEVVVGGAHLDGLGLLGVLRLVDLPLEDSGFGAVLGDQVVREDGAD